jgi:hypothetical protein
VLPLGFCIESIITHTRSSAELEAELDKLAMLVHCDQHDGGCPKDSRIDACLKLDFRSMRNQEMFFASLRSALLQCRAFAANRCAIWRPFAVPRARTVTTIH